MVLERIGSTLLFSLNPILSTVHVAMSIYFVVFNLLGAAALGSIQQLLVAASL